MNQNWSNQLSSKTNMENRSTFWFVCGGFIYIWAIGKYQLRAFGVEGKMRKNGECDAEPFKMYEKIQENQTNVWMPVTWPIENRNRIIPTARLRINLIPYNILYIFLEKRVDVQQRLPSFFISLCWLLANISWR